MWICKLFGHKFTIAGNPMFGGQKLLCPRCGEVRELSKKTDGRNPNESNNTDKTNGSV